MSLPCQIETETGSAGKQPARDTAYFVFMPFGYTVQVDLTYTNCNKKGLSFPAILLNPFLQFGSHMPKKIQHSFFQYQPEKRSTYFRTRQLASEVTENFSQLFLSFLSKVVSLRRFNIGVYCNKRLMCCELQK